MDSLHVLLMHDDLLVHHIVADALRDSGVELIIAENHVEGIKALRAWPIDVLIVQLSRISAADRFLRQTLAIRPFLGWVQIEDPCTKLTSSSFPASALLTQPLDCVEVASAVMGLASSLKRPAVA